MIVKKYCVPANLDVGIFVGDNFKARCLSIINYMEIAIHRKNAALDYVSIHSETLKALATDNYALYVNYLARKGIIQINRHYSNNEFATKGRFSKSYRFTPDYSGEVKIIEDIGIESRRKVRDRTDKTDTICVELAHSCCELTIDLEALQYQPHEIQEEAGALLTHLALGSACARRGSKVRRIYHRVNRASKEVRRLLRFNGRPLIEYDMKSAHPVLALSLYPDPHCLEALAYKELLRNDIYTFFDVSRERAKIFMRKFFYSKKHGIRKNGSSANPVANYFRVYFPFLFTGIVSSTDLAVRLQNLESYLFNDCIVPKALELDLFYISIHDGFSCASHKAAETLRYLIQTEFTHLFDYTPEIVAKDKHILGFYKIDSEISFRSRP